MLEDTGPTNARTATSRKRLRQVIHSWKKVVGLNAHGFVPTPPRSWPRMFELLDGLSDSPETLQDGLWVATTSPTGMNVIPHCGAGATTKVDAALPPCLPVGTLTRRRALLVLALSSWRGAAAHGAARNNSLRCQRIPQRSRQLHCTESV